MKQRMNQIQISDNLTKQMRRKMREIQLKMRLPKRKTRNDCIYSNNVCVKKSFSATLYLSPCLTNNKNTLITISHI